MEEGRGEDAVSMRLAEHYLDAFGNIAKKGNTIVLPNNAGDAASMVAQATAIYENLSRSKGGRVGGGDGEEEDEDDNSESGNGSFQPDPIQNVIRKLNSP